MSSARILARIRGLLRSAGVSLLVTLATLGAIELVLRTADFRALRQDASERSLTYGYDAELGWAPIPYSRSTITTARTIHARHNSLGFRDIAFHPDGRPIVLFIGDSFVWGVDAEANERFTDLLRPKLPRFQIVNAGVSGYGTDQEYLWLKRIWPSVRPSIVVLLFCTDNDRPDNMTNVRYNRYRKPYADTGADGTLVFKGEPVPKSLQLMIKDNWLVRNVWLARLATAVYADIASPQISVADPTERLVSKIREYVGAHDARLLVALQRTDERLMAHLRAERVPLVTLDGAATYGIAHGAHFTPEGHKFASRRLFDLLTETPTIGQGPRGTTSTNTTD
jgi:hypothetical protein